MMTRFFRFSAISVLLATSMAVSGQTSAYEPKSFLALVERISSGASNDERAAVIRQELQKAGVRVFSEGFMFDGKTPKEVKGTNFVAEVAGKEAMPAIMVGAHLDRVDVGSGSVDNAAGVAAAIMLLKAFKDRPLENHRFSIGLWDQEEKGLVGSRTYVKGRSSSTLPSIYINLDIFGYGNALWLQTKDEESRFTKSLTGASADARFPLKKSADYPPSDHLSFAAAGIESFAISLLTTGEIDQVREILATKKPGAAKPRVLSIIHTSEDTLDKIDAPAVVASLPVIEAAIRRFDKK